MVLNLCEFSQALRLQIEDSNKVKEEQKKSHVSEIKANLFA